MQRLIRRLMSLALATAFMIAGPALAAESAPVPVLSPTMQPLGFLIGRWSSGGGRAENGVSVKGVSAIAPAAGGRALLRQDHTDLFGPNGKPLEGFDQVMLVYPESGGLRADYFDGSHVIHYVSAIVEPGRSVVFLTAASPSAPRFRLSYRVETLDSLTVKFEMAQPGDSAFQIIAEGDLKRRN